jgi:hypothetical protein
MTSAPGLDADEHGLAVLDEAAQRLELRRRGRAVCHHDDRPAGERGLQRRGPAAVEQQRMLAAEDLRRGRP